jgi:ferredoxin
MCVVKKWKRFPVIDLSDCNLCGGCSEVAPEVFCYNSVMGIMEVVESQVYPQDLVDEAIKNCPKDCIVWDEFI